MLHFGSAADVTSYVHLRVIGQLSALPSDRFHEPIIRSSPGGSLFHVCVYLFCVLFLLFCCCFLLFCVITSRTH